MFFFAELPTVLNPKRGFIVTANNKPGKITQTLYFKSMNLLTELRELKS
ncbi:MAG: penicillin acylase family protein [Ignavibacteria bacterium]|nr:penicillin acylase family protein [Ignavibacteria bacterium]